MSHNDNVSNCNKINIWFFFHAKNLEAECCKWSRYWVTQMIAPLPVQKVRTALLWLRALTLSYIHMAVTFTMQEQKQGLTSFGFRNSQGTVWKALREGGRDCGEESRGFGFCSERLGEAGMWWAEEKGGEIHILNVSVAFCWEQKREPHQSSVSGLTTNENHGLNGMGRPMYFECNMRERRDRDVPQTPIYTKPNK